MDISLLVPVKDLSRAKTRLTPLLTPTERERLATIMLEGVLRAVAALPARFGRAVVTSYPPAAALAEGLGFRHLPETRQVSESASVDAAAATLAAEGVAGVFRLPLDLPLIDGADLAEVLARAEAGERTVLVPSADGTGTNGIYRAPPTLFPSHFGPGSMALHRAAAAERGVTPAVLPLRSLALDIDDAADVAALMATGAACPAADFLRGIGVPARLARQQAAQ